MAESLHSDNNDQISYPNNLIHTSVRNAWVRLAPWSSASMSVVTVTFDICIHLYLITGEVSFSSLIPVALIY